MTWSAAYPCLCKMLGVRELPRPFAEAVLGLFLRKAGGPKTITLWDVLSFTWDDLGGKGRLPESFREVSIPIYFDVCVHGPIGRFIHPI